MDQDRLWSRGRSGWSGEGLGLREGADGSAQSPRRMYPPGSQPHHKYLPNRPIWDDTVNDLASMRLTPAELARKLASRQSSNMVIARAQLLEQSRRPGSCNPNLPPNLAARLQAARQQSVDSVLAQSNAVLLASQKIRKSESCDETQDTIQRQRDPDGQEDTSVLENTQQGMSSGRTTPQPGRTTPQPGRTTPQPGRTTPQPRGLLKSDDEDSGSFKPHRNTSSPMRSKSVSEEKLSMASSRESAGRSSAHSTPKHHGTPPKPARRLSADGAATRTSLDHTITMVVNTCRELWQQLQEERATRERLQQQLHQQGNVITTLTSELLQIQDQQEAILREVNDARASGLWGGELDLDVGGGGGISRGEDMIGTQSMSGLMTGGRPSSQLPSSRHPQRSILRATRTIHQPHSRQTPPYQSHHQPCTFTSLPYQPPHSPRPHQPSGSRDSSPPLGPPMGGAAAMRSEASAIHYRNSIAKQIRDALASRQASAYASDLTKLSNQLSKESLQHEASQMKTVDKERANGEHQTASSADKENAMSLADGNHMNSSVTEKTGKD